MPGALPPNSQQDVSQTWRAYQAEDHERRIDLIQLLFAMAVLSGLTVTGLVLILRPDAPDEQVKIAYGWIGAVLGAWTNMLRRP